MILINCKSFETQSCCACKDPCERQNIWDQNTPWEPRLYDFRGISVSLQMSMLGHPLGLNPRSNNNRQPSKVSIHKYCSLQKQVKLTGLQYILFFMV